MKKKIFILFVLIGLGALALIGHKNTSVFGPHLTEAQQPPQISFHDINDDVIINNATPSYQLTEKIANNLFDNLSVVAVPKAIQDSIANEVALAHLNGTSTIDEANIVSAVNHLATQSSAPSFASTNVEQVKVVRAFLRTVIPNLVKSDGDMSDLEAYAVFTTIISQKFQNEAYMVTPAEFTASLSNPSQRPFPGTPEAAQSNIQVIQNTAEMNQMQNVLDNYADSKNFVSTSEVLGLIGIN